MRAAEVLEEEEAASAEAGRRARQAHCDALEEGHPSRKRAATPMPQEGHGKAHRSAAAVEAEMAVAVDFSDYDEDVDANIEELLELRSLGEKVVIPDRKRKTATTTPQVGDSDSTEREAKKLRIDKSQGSVCVGVREPERG